MQKIDKRNLRRFHTRGRTTKVGGIDPRVFMDETILEGAIFGPYENTRWKVNQKHLPVNFPGQDSWETWK